MIKVTAYDSFLSVTLSLLEDTGISYPGKWSELAAPSQPESRTRPNESHWPAQIQWPALESCPRSDRSRMSSTPRHSQFKNVIAKKQDFIFYLPPSARCIFGS